jgi:Mg2+/Co2+ transporter CorB
MAGAVLLLLLLAAVFSGCETALTAASRTKLHELERRGNRRAGIVLKLTGGREATTGALLLAKTIANLLAAVLVAAYCVDSFGLIGIIYAAALMTALILVCVEILPKSLAILDPDRLAMTAAPALRIALAPLAAIVMAAESVIRRLTRLTGASLPPNQDVLSAHLELRGAIDLHHREGAVVKKDRDMLGGILDLSELEVSDVMVHRTKMLSFDVKTPVAKILEDILKSGHTRVPIWKDNADNIVGILNAKDLFAELHKNGGDATKVNIEDIMSAPWFVPDTRALSDQLNAFLRRRSHFAIVVDEYGEMMGVVTLEDIIEEIVGEISDEHDTVATGVRQQADGSFIIDGTVPVRDVNRILDWRLPDEEATTIAGLVIHEARMIPVTGQAFTFHGFRFEVVRKRRHQITALRVTPLNR